MAETTTPYAVPTPAAERPCVRPVAASPATLTGQPSWLGDARLWACLLVVPAVAALFATAPALLKRQFWLDEIYTYTLVGDPDLPHAMRALAGAVETHPPTFYLLQRCYTWLTGVNEVSLRAFALGSAGLTLAGVFLLLRRNYSFLVALTTALVLWSHPLVQHYAFEARCYSPWTAAVVWLVYFLVRSRTTSGFTAWLPVAITAALVCTMHYFGIITLGLVVAAEFWVCPPRGGKRWPVVLALFAGPLALAACWPLLRSQRAIMGSATWVTPIDVRSALTFARAVVMPGIWFVTLEVLALALWVRERWRAKPSSRSSAPSRHNELAGFVALAGFPVVLILFSYFVQPAHVSRYALPATVCLVPVIAYLASRLRPPVMLVLATLTALLSGAGLHHQVIGYQARDAALEALAADIRANTGNEPVRFWFSLPLYVVCHYHPDLAPRCCLVEPGPEGTYAPEHHLALIFQNRLAHSYETYYGVPRVRQWERIPPEQGYYVVPGGWHTMAMPGSLSPPMLCPPGLDLAVPDWTVECRGHGLYLLKPRHPGAGLPPLNPYAWREEVGAAAR